MPDYHLTIENLDKFKQAIAAAPEESAKEIQSAMATSLLVIEAAAKMNAPVGVTGQLRNSWTRTLEPFKGQLTSGVNYGVFVEKGTRPHWPPYSGAKGRSLAQWARTKGISPFLVARSIARKGTKAHPFFEPAVEGSNQRINQEFEKAIGNVIMRIANQSR